MITDRTKRRLQAGETLAGCFVRTADATFVEYVAAGGWDFLVLDGEHGTVMPDRVGDLARACEVREVTPIVRMPTRDPGTLLKCLDAGAVGVLFPWINSADDASRAVSAVKYPPKGIRGLAGNRATDWTVSAEMTARANDAVIVIAQIETVAAVDAVEDLCTVEGVDVLFVGPSDLSQSLGVPGELSNPVVLEAIEHVASTVARSEKTFGIFAGSAEDARRGLDLGATFIATSVESMLGGPMRSFLRGIRSG